MALTGCLNSRVTASLASGPVQDFRSAGVPPIGANGPPARDLQRLRQCRGAVDQMARSVRARVHDGQRRGGELEVTFAASDAV